MEALITLSSEEDAEKIMSAVKEAYPTFNYSICQKELAGELWYMVYAQPQPGAYEIITTVRVWVDGFYYGMKDYGAK
jgi:hypothetical protein